MSSTGSQSPTNTPSSTTITSTPKPTAPLMGTTEETYIGSKVFYYAFGGEPESDWTGVTNTNERLMSDLCFRSLDPVAGQKSTQRRTKGLSDKFEAKHNLTEFQVTI